MMDNNAISLFLNKKKINISKYAEIFIKYTLNNNVKLNKIINKIVEIYIDDFYLQGNNDFSLLSKYFEIKESKESIMKNVLLSSIIFYQNSGLEKQIEKDIKTIVILSNVIFLSLNFDNFINEYHNSEITIEDRINSFMDKFQKKIKIKPEDILNFINDITVQTKKDVTSEKRFWKNLQDNNFILEYRKSLKNNNYYLVNYSYNIKTLNRYDQNEVMAISNSKGIYDDILSIYLEKLSIMALQNYLNKHYNDKFFINIYTDYFNKNKNILKIKSIFAESSIRNSVVFLFEYSNLKNSMNVIKDLNNENFLIGLYNIPENASIKNNDFNLFNYVFISDNLYNKYKDCHELWKLKEITFIIDDEFIRCDTNKILTEIR